MKLTPLFQKIKTRHFTQSSLDLVRGLVLEEYFTIKNGRYELKECIHDELTIIDVFLILNQTTYFTQSSLDLMYDVILLDHFIIIDGDLIPKGKVVDEIRILNCIKVMRLSKRKVVEFHYN